MLLESWRLGHARHRVSCGFTMPTTVILHPCWRWHTSGLRYSSAAQAVALFHVAVWQILLLVCYNCIPHVWRCTMQQWLWGWLPEPVQLVTCYFSDVTMRFSSYGSRTRQGPGRLKAQMSDRGTGVPDFDKQGRRRQQHHSQSHKLLSQPKPANPPGASELAVTSAKHK